MLRRLAVAGALAPALALAAPAHAEPLLDRVQVGNPEISATRGFARSLAVTLPVPKGYARACCYTFTQGQWAGPPWRASGIPGAGEPSTVNWFVTFTRGKSIKAVAKNAWSQFPQVAAGKRKVRHVIDRKAAGKLNAYAVIDAQPSPGAAVYAALAIDLGRKVTALVSFSLTNPPVDADGAFGALTVNGMPASTWNRRQADAVLKSVYIEGLLPPARITARASGRNITGRVTDQFKRPESTIPVVLKRGRKVVAKAMTNRRGNFRLSAPRPGRYKLSSTLAGTTVSRSVTVR
jgi:hypothetical protein